MIHFRKYCLLSIAMPICCSKFQIKTESNAKFQMDKNKIIEYPKNPRYNSMNWLQIAKNKIKKHKENSKERRIKWVCDAKLLIQMKKSIHEKDIAFNDMKLQRSKIQQRINETNRKIRQGIKNSNLSQNSTVLVRALIFFFSLGGYFRNLHLSKLRSFDISIHFHDNN
jgi:acetyl-CoA carboxylase beta subunit